MHNALHGLDKKAEARISTVGSPPQHGFRLGSTMLWVLYIVCFTPLHIPWYSSGPDAMKSCILAIGPFFYPFWGQRIAFSLCLDVTY